MNYKIPKSICNIALLACVCFLASCGEPSSIEETDLAPKVDLGTTIGDLAEAFSINSIPVEGYGVVAGLNGTGSSECPPQIRNYLTQYILQKLPREGTNVEQFINSKDTAVVILRGIMPTTAVANRYFDVEVIALPGTQTTSLKGGYLYGAELKQQGSFGLTIKVLAQAEGPVYIDTIDKSATNKRRGFILAGATVLDKYRITLGLRQPDYKTAKLIRDKLNERFGERTANAISDGQIELKIPDAYVNQKRRFAAIIQSIYLFESENITNERIKVFVRKLATGDRLTSEIHLEAIGNKSIDHLRALLNSSNEQVRFSAARCMLNLDSSEGLETLKDIAQDTDSQYRTAALRTITVAAKRKEAATIARTLLKDEDFDIRIAAYEQLRKLNDITVSHELVGRSFYLEQIAQSEPASIFVSRAGQPRIVLFNAPLYCKDNIFIQSKDGNTTINAPAGQDHVSLIRRHPQKPNMIIKHKSSFKLSDIIRALCEEPVKKKGQGPAGLNVSYEEMIALLKQMTDKGAIKAQFKAGPMPKTGVNIK